MKLRIKVEFWAVGQKTKKVKTVTAPVKVGEVEGFEDSRTSWVIDEAGENCVKVSYRCYDGTVAKTWELKANDEFFYRPMSFDGGNQYTIKLIK